jgi:biotin carboxyl carrier protein
VVRDNRATVGVCTSPVAGRVLSLAVGLGASVTTGQVVATVQGPDGEQSLRAPQSGNVTEIYVRVGQNVTAGGVVIVLG